MLLPWGSVLVIDVATAARRRACSTAGKHRTHPVIVVPAVVHCR